MLPKRFRQSGNSAAQTPLASCLTGYVTLQSRQPAGLVASPDVRSGGRRDALNLRLSSADRYHTVK